MPLDNIRDRDTWPTRELLRLAERIDRELATRQRQPRSGSKPAIDHAELETLEQRLLREAKQFQQTARSGVIRG
ncbi:MAG: hypothetical protein JJT90_03840 [Ectothiorhodospiraceae bacterium]|nr:hypothetical protein [Ectothiorhodospiraceae bacterium]